MSKHGCLIAASTADREWRELNARIRAEPRPRQDPWVPHVVIAPPDVTAWRRNERGYPHRPYTVERVWNAGWVAAFVGQDDGGQWWFATKHGPWGSGTQRVCEGFNSEQEAMDRCDGVLQAARVVLPTA